jgi:hypothetical protein
MNEPLTPASFVAMVRTNQKLRKPGFWVDVKVFDENDEEITLECRVDVEKERDPYATGDSPTMYEVEVYEVLCNDEDMPDAEYTYSDQIDKAAIAAYCG